MSSSLASTRGWKAHTTGFGDTVELSSGASQSSSGAPARLLGRAPKKLLKDVSGAGSPLGVDITGQSPSSNSPSSHLFVTAPDTVPPPMVPTLSLGEPRHVVRASAKEYLDTSVLTNRTRTEGGALTPEQAYVRLLRRDVKLAQQGTTGADEVPSLTSASPTVTRAESSGGAPLAAAHHHGAASAEGKQGDRPQQLTCDALRHPLKPNKTTSVARSKGANKDGAAHTVPGVNGLCDGDDSDLDGEESHELPDGDDEDDPSNNDTDYVNPFSPSASPKMRAAAEARATETAALLDTLDAIHATWARDGEALFQCLYEKGQLQQECAKDGVSAFAKELGTVEAVATLPALATVRDRAERLSAMITSTETPAGRQAGTAVSEENRTCADEGRPSGDAGGGWKDEADAMNSGSASITPWSLLVPSSAAAASTGLPPSAQDSERDMHMKLTETKLKYLVDHELRVGRENLLRALRSEGAESFDSTVDF